MTDIQIAPQAPEIEAAVIGAIISGGHDIYDIAAPLLTPAMFFDKLNADVFMILASMHANGTPINLTTVVTAARDRGQSETITPMFLASYMREYTPENQIETYCHIIAEKSAARHVIKRLQDILTDVYINTPLDEISEDLNRLDAEIADVFTSGETGADMRTVMLNTLADQDKKIVNYQGGRYSGLTTGFKQLDAKTGGLQPGSLTILAGRPGSGKTSIALHVAESASRQGAPVIYFSFEMTAGQIGEILISRLSGIDRITLRDGMATADDMAIIQRVAGEVERLNIRLFDNPGLTTSWIEAIVKKYTKRHGQALVIADYLQLITPEDKKAIREQQISAISRHLKKIAMVLKIPVLCLCQLNREGAKGEPQIWHLRESGAIEQDADAVLLIWRPTAEETKELADIPNIDRQLKLKIAKNRHGQEGLIDIYHNGQFTAFSENDRFDTMTSPQEKTPEPTRDNKLPF